jgi:hypothetical protein
MAIADWAYSTGINGSVHHGPTLEIDPPAGAGDFSYGFNSADVAGSGVVSLAFKPPSFNFTKGGEVSAAISKVSPEGDGHSIFVFTQMGDGTDGGAVTDSVYMLGIQNDPTNRLVLAKGPANAGIPSGDAGSDNGDTRIIAKGSESIAIGDYIHVRLSAIVQTGGDVLLVCETNSVALGSTPVWEPIAGMPDRIVDGVTQIVTGSAPLAAGRAGFGWHFDQTGKAASADYQAGRRQVG